MFFSEQDHLYMARALRVAEQGAYIAMPNPHVGCLLVRDGVVLGEGHSQPAGSDHAEIQALKACRAKGFEPRGATAYVTLEPCAHFGRTPPCANALVEAGVSRVVAALQDPFPAVAGRGFAILQQAGIATAAGLMDNEARELHRGFLSRVQRSRPWLTLKVAASLDGKTALANGESQWITGAPARADVQKWRARASGILTGIGTVLADDPQMTVRTIDGIPWHIPRQPARIIVDSQLRTPPTARILQPPGNVIVACATPAAEAQAMLTAAGAQVCSMPSAGGQVDLAALLKQLAGEGMNEILVEAGAILNGALLMAGLVDEILLYQAPVLLGGAGRDLADFTLTRLAEKFSPRVIDRRMLGTDTRWTLRLN